MTWCPKLLVNKKLFQSIFKETIIVTYKLLVFLHQYFVRENKPLLVTTLFQLFVFAFSRACFADDSAPSLVRK